VNGLRRSEYISMLDDIKSYSVFLMDWSRIVQLLFEMF